MPCDFDGFCDHQIQAVAEVPLVLPRRHLRHLNLTASFVGTVEISSPNAARQPDCPLVRGPTSELIAEGFERNDYVLFQDVGDFLLFSKRKPHPVSYPK